MPQRLLTLQAQKLPWHLRPGGQILLLSLITLLGGVLRFYKLTFPALWNDETLVFWRVCGTYGQMLEPLRTDGFPPLHYSLYWLMGHPIPLDSYVMQRVLGCMVALIVISALLAGLAYCGWRLSRVGPIGVNRTATTLAILIPVLAVLCGILVVKLLHSGGAFFFPEHWSPGRHSWIPSPWAIRAIPACSGLMTVPAIYFFARQLVGKTTSLVAALLCACSAFMLFYSRDAKMYPDAWLFVALNLGALLWWFRAQTSTAFLCWVAAGCAMVGLHASTFTIPAVSLLLLFVQKTFSIKRTLLFVLGLLLIFTGPLGYYLKFNIWTERVSTDGWRDSGLGWVGGFFNGNRTGPEHFKYTTSAFLLGWEWPRDDYLPGPDGREPVQPIPEELFTGPRTAVLEICGLLLLGALPWPLLWLPRRNLDRPPQPPWRVYFTLMAIILPLSYGFYCYSVHGFTSPQRWLYETVEAIRLGGVIAILGGVAVYVTVSLIHRPLRPRLIVFGQYLLCSAVLIGLCWGVFAMLFPVAADGFLSGKPFESVWTPRYLGFLWPAVGVGAAALFMRLPGRPTRIAAVAFFCLVNVGMFGLRMSLGTEPPIDIQARDEWLAQDVNGVKSKVHTFDYIVHGGIAVAESALDPDSGKVTAGRYYLLYDSNGVIPNDPDHHPINPEMFEQFLGWNAWFGIGFNLRDEYNPWQFKRDLSMSPQLERVIIWSRQEPVVRGALERDFASPEQVRLPQDVDDRLLAGWNVQRHQVTHLFPPGWKLKTEDIYTVHNPWDWRTFSYWVRREYVCTKLPNSAAVKPSNPSKTR